MTYRIIHWATGHTGKMIVRAMAERDNYQAVGAFVYNPEKAGADLGTLCGIDKLRVVATNDRDAILRTEADCVLFLGSAEVDVAQSLKDVCALLASGKNVITTAVQFIYPKSMGAEFEGAIRAACEKGGSTFHGLGVMPGFFAESLPLLLSRLARRIDLLDAYETLMYDKYPSKFQMFDLMGFGYAPDDKTPLFANLDIVGQVWRHSALLLADTFKLDYERIEDFRNVAVTDRDLQVASGTIAEGTVGAMNFGARVIVDGKPRIVLQHYTRMAEHLAPDWPSGDGWTVQMEGEPFIKAKIEIGSHNSIMPTDDACMATAMHAIHAVPYVVAAKPGILTLADVPPVWGADAFHVRA